MNEPRIIFHGIVYYEKKIIPFCLQAFLSPMISQFWLRQLQNFGEKNNCSKCSPRNVECSFDNPAENFSLNVWKN